MQSSVLVAVLALAFIASAKTTEGLPKLNINPSTVTISGISAGAFMAVQYQFAWSSQINGAAIVAGGPFLCAAGGMQYMCMYSPDMVNIGTLESYAVGAAKEGKIDPIANVANHTVLLFSGILDSLVAQGTMIKLGEMYQKFGVKKDNGIAEFSKLAEHAWVTSKYGNSCSTLGAPYVNNCQWDAAGKFLNLTFAKKFGIKLQPEGTVDKSNFQKFSQTPYGADALTNSMGAEGYIYVPKQCAAGKKCHLHLNFHGCTQGMTNIGDEYVTQTQINDWAETNDIVVLYPQIQANSLLSNPEGCFDWWGYTNSDYAFKNGVQMQIVHKMVTQLTGQ